MPCIGLITTGHGPRNEYVEFHRGLIAALGYDVEVIDEHILDGLGWEDIAPNRGGPDEHVLGAYVRLPDADGPKLANGATHAYLRREWAASRIQRCIDRLVERGADFIVLCACAPFPAAAFKSPVPFLKPAEITANTIKELAEHSTARLRMGLLTTAGHGVKDREHWQQFSFAANLEIVNVIFEADIIGAAEELAAHDLDIVVVWTFGWGLTATTKDSLSAQLERILKCPVLMPHRATALTVAGLLQCGFDDRRFAA